jgi:hypothetical protein
MAIVRLCSHDLYYLRVTRPAAEASEFVLLHPYHMARTIALLLRFIEGSLASLNTGHHTE